MRGNYFFKALFLSVLIIVFTVLSFAQFPNIKKISKTPAEVTKSTKETKTSKNESNESKNEKVNTETQVLSSGKTLFVSIKNGNNKNDGSQANPYKDIDKAIQTAAPGTEIKIAGGTYSGIFGIGFLESDKPLKLLGSFDDDFQKQDIKNHPTIFQPDNASGAKSRKALLKFTKEVAGTIIDGILFDMGERNAYSPKEGIVSGVEGGRMLQPTENPGNGINSTVNEPCIQFVSAAAGGDVTIQNCVFVNGANFALQAGHRSGKFTVRNNVFVSNKMAAIEIFGTCAGSNQNKDMTKCGEVEIAYNTILFTWSRLKDFLDMGYGVRIMTKCSYDIHHNIIGGSILAAVDHSRFTKNEWIKVDNNIFFVNKQADFFYCPASNTKLNLMVDQFGDLELGSVSGNKNEIPKGLKVNKAYLEGYLNARYNEKTDYNSNSSSNQWREAMGMNKQGKIQSTVSMFANKYPWKETLDLFGSVEGVGAQKPQ